MPPSTPELQTLPALPRDREGPVFDEPWQAHAFALAVRLAEAGCFSWSEWVAALSQEIREAQTRAGPDVGSTYYQQWLNGLERLCVAKGLVNVVGLQERKKAWLQAYRHTPHGRPVELSAAGEGG